MCIHSIGLWCYAVNMICYPEKFCTTNQSSSLIDFNICNWISELCWKKVHIKVHHSNRISVSITVFQFLDLEKSHLYVWPTYLKSWSILNLTVIVKNLEQQILRYHSNTYQHYYIRLHYGNFFIGSKIHISIINTHMICLNIALKHEIFENHVLPLHYALIETKCNYCESFNGTYCWLFLWTLAMIILLLSTLPSPLNITCPYKIKK